jgi:UDP-GlcNAc:undecaprenyl-phosphate GlcNAc-1-phosphate transferase
LPLLIPIAIWLIPYTDLLLAVVRRTAAGKSPFDADKLHLHHRLLNLGHSHRQSVLLMYLWTALFAGLVVGLSTVRISLIWFALATLVAIVALLLATAPKLRPWRSVQRSSGAGRHAAEGQSHRGAAAVSVNNGAAAPGPVPGVRPERFSPGDSVPVPPPLPRRRAGNTVAGPPESGRGAR